MQTPTNQRIKMSIPNAPIRTRVQRTISPSAIKRIILFPETPTDSMISNNKRCHAPRKNRVPINQSILEDLNEGCVNLNQAFEEEFKAEQARKVPQRPKKKTRTIAFDRENVRVNLGGDFV